MNAARKESILIVDENTAFATILKEGLEQGGAYHTVLTSNGEEALQALDGASFDLVIIDLGLSDPDGLSLAHTVREQLPDQKLMLIPLMGENLPPEANALGISGILTKPFFFPDLPGIIASALAEEEEAPISPPSAFSEDESDEEKTVLEEEKGERKEKEAPPVDLPALPDDERVARRIAEVRASISDKRLQRITQAMENLSQDINAEAVILSCEGALLAYAGMLPEGDAEGLARIVGENWRMSERVARILGRSQSHFEQSVEGGEFILYSLVVFKDVILSTAQGTATPLGLIRHSTKYTVDTLRRLMGHG